MLLAGGKSTTLLATVLVVVVVAHVQASHDEIDRETDNSLRTKRSTCGCTYEYAGTKCSGGPTPGAKQLASYLKRKYGSRQEIYNCRNVRGGYRKSLHAEGRAVDHYASGSQGAQIFSDLINIACANGIQEVIFNKRIWTQAKGIQNYGGVNPHTDHVHVGLNRCGARQFNL